MAATGKWYIGTDSKVHLVGLKDDTGAFINNATSVVGTFTDTKRVPVPGATPVTFAYLAASSGNYDGTLAAIDTLKEGVEYHLYIVVLSSGRKFTGRIVLKAEYYPL